MWVVFLGGLPSCCSQGPRYSLCSATSHGHKQVSGPQNSHLGAESAGRGVAMCSCEAQSPSLEDEAMKSWSAAPRATAAKFFDCSGDFEPCPSLSYVAIAWHQQSAAHRLPSPVISNSGSAYSQLNQSITPIPPCP